MPVPAYVSIIAATALAPAPAPAPPAAPLVYAPPTVPLVHGPPAVSPVRAPPGLLTAPIELVPTTKPAPVTAQVPPQNHEEPPGYMTFSIKFSSEWRERTGEAHPEGDLRDLPHPPGEPDGGA